MPELTDYTIASTPEQLEKRKKDAVISEAKKIYSELNQNYIYLTSDIRSQRTTDIAESNLKRVLDDLYNKPEVLSALQSYLQEINETRFKVVEENGQLDLKYLPATDERRS